MFEFYKPTQKQMINDVCKDQKKGKKKKKLKSCENTRSLWLEPDEVWPVLYFFIWNEETTMEKWSVSNKRWKAAGSRALFSSELVPASMMPIRRRVKWEVKWEAGEDGGGPASEGGCVRRIPKRKRTCRHGGGQHKYKPGFRDMLSNGGHLQFPPEVQELGNRAQSAQMFIHQQVLKTEDNREHFGKSEPLQSKLYLSAISPQFCRHRFPRLCFLLLYLYANGGRRKDEWSFKGLGPVFVLDLEQEEPVLTVSENECWE